jgi:signal transduction histidine kinase
LLEVSKIESHSFRLNTKATTDLNEKIEQIINDIGIVTSFKHGLRLLMSKSVESHLVKVDDDISRFSEVLFSLIGNAIRFTEH